MANEGAAVIDIRVRTRMESDAEARLRELNKEVEKSKAGMVGLGNAATATGTKFSKFGHIVQEEVFELNSRKAKRFVDMFLGGGLFSIGISLTSAAFSKLGDVIKEEMEKGQKATEAFNTYLESVVDRGKDFARLSGSELSDGLQNVTERLRSNARAAKELDDQLKGTGFTFESLLNTENEYLPQRLQHLQSEASKVWQVNQALSAQYQELVKLKQAAADLATEEAMAAYNNESVQRDIIAPIEEARKRRREQDELSARLDEDIRAGAAVNPYAAGLDTTKVQENLMAQEKKYAEEQAKLKEESDRKAARVKEMMHRDQMQREQEMLQTQMQYAEIGANAYIDFWSYAFETTAENGALSFADLANSFLGAVGSMAKSFGRMLIMAGIGKALLGDPSGLGAAAMGTALMAFGSVITGLSKRHKPAEASGGGGGFAGGGSSSYNGAYQAGGNPNMAQGQQPYMSSSGGGGYSGGGNSSVTYVVNIGGQPVSDKISIARAVTEAISEGSRLGYTYVPAHAIR